MERLYDQPSVWLGAPIHSSRRPSSYASYFDLVAELAP